MNDHSGSAERPVTDSVYYEILTSSGTVLITRVSQARPGDMQALYLAGDWWQDEWDDRYLSALVKMSFAFVAATAPDGSWIGMGRLISDGVSDAYLQDIVVLPSWEGNGIGSAIVRSLLAICKEHGITWIGTIGGPQTEYFYRKFGFSRMCGYIPMRYER
ncbi:MAG: GNAT family N-acetyltransferase [Methanospirillum sp.]|uniref:GNAT family N-acetyltransferase n=1 Tax=Methanospirillum sp. TaxID=45200 RepID=UPI002372C30E|nr:GNAT family N-acetyltransferase [Methanospirillum sp.]MDD1729955.1 GNAT family N-acetyltransferase [Methanospirillum sp.]